jgi:hypothetical protein
MRHDWEKRPPHEDDVLAYWLSSMGGELSDDQWKTAFDFLMEIDLFNEVELFAHRLVRHRLGLPKEGGDV